MSQAASASLIQRLSPDGQVVVALVGELDAATRPPLQERLYELVEDEDTTIDLGPAEFVDLGSVRMLVGCRERARLNGHRVEIVNEPSYVGRMLDMLERGHYWRPERLVRNLERDPYAPAPRTTTDAQRSRPASEQIVRLQCRNCGNQTFRPELSLRRDCDVCGTRLELIAVFRDRRQTQARVDVDRRQD